MESVEKLFQNPIQGHYKENTGYLDKSGQEEWTSKCGALWVGSKESGLGKCFFFAVTWQVNIWTVIFVRSHWRK